MRRTNSMSKHLGWLAIVAGLTIALPPANAETVVEMLEKGIYTEETVGNLDEAIQFYEKVVRQGNESAKAAAEAQFRIGVCYEKQGKTDLAQTAFQSVVDNYPTAKALVNKAKRHLKPNLELLSVPWSDGDEMHFEMKLQNGMGAGIQVWRVAKSNLSGQPMWECNTWQVVTLNDHRSRSRVFADTKTFSPVKSTWTHTLLGEAQAKYEPEQVVIQLSKKQDATTLETSETYFDNEQAAQLFRRLPLRVGYKSTLNIVSTLATSLVPLEIEVTKMETVEAPAGTFDCFRLQLNIGQTFWISNDQHRYIVKFEGGGISASLTNVRKTKLGDATTLETERFKTVLPPNWFAYTPSGTEASDSEHTTLVDPLAETSSGIKSQALESLKDQHETPGAWLQSSLDKNKKTQKEFELNSNGIQSIKVGRHDAAVAEFEFLDGNQKMIARRIAVFGITSAVSLHFTCKKDRFDELQPSMQKIAEVLIVE